MKNYKKKISKEHEEEQAKLFERARARLLENQQQSNIPKEAHAYYYALGLPVGTDMKTVKAKYFQLAKLYHPDKHLNSSEILRRRGRSLFQASIKSILWPYTGFRGMMLRTTTKGAQRRV